MTDHEGVDKKEFNLQDLQKGSSDAFRIFFLKFYGEFFSFAHLLLRHKTASRKLTSAAFFMLWAKHQDFDSEKNIRAFLYTFIRDGSLQYLRYFQQNPDSGEYAPGGSFSESLPEGMLQELSAYADNFGTGV